MKCKNCIYYEACAYYIGEETVRTTNECSISFKHRDQYVKLPVYIGQPVWTIRSMYQWAAEDFKIFDYELESGKISMIQQKADKSWKFRATINSSVSDYTLDEVGKNIFFSEAEAMEECNRRVAEINI